MLLGALKLRPPKLIKVFMIELAQVFIDILTWFLYPFAIVFIVTWVVSLFRSR